jgi:anti-anti-sigma factor
MSENKISCTKSGVKTFIAPDFALIGENISLLDEEIKKCISANELRLVIDFQLVPYIDSEGLEKLLEYYHQVRRSGGSLEIFNPNPLCNEILNVTCVTDYLDIYFNLNKAGGNSSEGRITG